MAFNFFGIVSRAPKAPEKAPSEPKEASRKEEAPKEVSGEKEEFSGRFFKESEKRTERPVDIFSRGRAGYLHRNQYFKSLEKAHKDVFAHNPLEKHYVDAREQDEVLGRYFPGLKGKTFLKRSYVGKRLKELEREKFSATPTRKKQIGKEMEVLEKSRWAS